VIPSSGNAERPLNEKVSGRFRYMLDQLSDDDLRKLSSQFDPDGGSSADVEIHRRLTEECRRRRLG
jgi:hypothetical protein